MAHNTSMLIDKHIKGDKVFTKVDSETILCNVCDSRLILKKNSVKSSILTHKATDKHIKKHKLWLDQQLVQQTLSNNSNYSNEFFKRVGHLFNALNIPYYRLNHPVWQQFCTEFCHKQSPEESTIRKYYVKSIFTEAIARIIRDVGDSSIYLQVDESTMHSRRIVAVLVGRLDGNIPRSWLFNMVELNEPPNHSNIQQIVLDSLHILWQGNLYYDRFRLLLTDQASYCLLAGVNLKTIFTKLYHVTCLCHGLNRVASLAQELYPNLDKFVCKFRKIFGKKSLQRKSILEDILGEKIPSGPCQTRWGTWLNYCNFLYDKLDRIKEALMIINDASIPGFETLLELVQKDEIYDDLGHMLALKPIVESITKLETSGLTIYEQRNVIVDVKTRIPPAYKAKLDSSLSKNPDFDTIFTSLSRDDRAGPFLYAPLTSVDVERNFSTLKWIFDDKRTKFTPENLKHYVISSVNSTKPVI